MLYKTVDLTDDEKARILNKIKPYIKALKILIEAKIDKHYEGYYMIGLYFELERIYDKALKYYRKSLSFVQSYLKQNESHIEFIDLNREITRCIERTQKKESHLFATGHKLCRRKMIW